MALIPFEDEEDEGGLCLDNDSFIVTGDEGIPIKGFTGHKTTLSHEEQQRIRPRHPGACSHENMRLDVDPQRKRMAYSCEDCSVTVIEGHMTTFVYQSQRFADEFNNPFITGQH